MASSVTETIDTLKNTSENQDKIKFGSIVDALDQRGFGPILVALALINILPTGAIPFVPAICALLIIGIAMQMLMQQKTPWVPSKLREMSFDKQKMDKALSKAKPWTKKLDQLFKERLTQLNNPVTRSIIAVICILMSFAIIVIGFIPFAAMVPGLVIFFFGIGLTFNDGVMNLVGLIGFVFASIFTFNMI